MHIPVYHMANLYTGVRRPRLGFHKQGESFAKRRTVREFTSQRSRKSYGPPRKLGAALSRLDNLVFGNHEIDWPKLFTPLNDILKYIFLCKCIRSVMPHCSSYKKGIHSLKKSVFHTFAVQIVLQIESAVSENRSRWR